MKKRGNWSGLYFIEWGKVRKMLVASRGWDSTRIEQYRHELHVRALGYDKSHKDLTKTERDKILAVFRAHSQPTDVKAQVRQLEQPLKRCQHALEKLVNELELSPNYIESMARKICKKPLDECDEQDLPKLIAALTFHKNRLAKKESESIANGDPF